LAITIKEEAVPPFHLDGTAKVVIDIMVEIKNI